MKLCMSLLCAIVISTTYADNGLSSDWTKQLKNKEFLRFKPQVLSQLLLSAKKSIPSGVLNNKHKFLVTLDRSLQLDDFTRIENIDSIDTALIKDSIFIVYFHTDDDYVYTLKKIQDNNGKYMSLPHYLKTRYVWADKYAMLAIDDTFSFGTKISHLNLEVHETICQAIKMTNNLPGAYIEIGVFMGGSALTALNYMKYSGAKREAYFFDTFDGMTYQEAHASPDMIWDNTHILWGVDETMQYVGDILKTTSQEFKLVKSNICTDELPAEIDKIAVCNMDVDLYEATVAGLMKVAPKIVKGGIIICEDPTSTPALGGALVAMEEFLATPEGSKFTKVLLNGAQYLLIKVQD